MYTIIVERECGCFKRSEIENNITLDSKDDALMKSIEIKDIMNDKFCGKHKFSVREEENRFIIGMNI